MIYETIPIMRLSADNKLITPDEKLPELVHLNDDARSVFIDFSKTPPITIPPNTPIDIAIYEMKARHQTMLLVEDNEQIVGFIGIEDLLGEYPIRIMSQRGLTRTELMVSPLMTPRDQIFVIDSSHLRHAQVGHILNTIKNHSTHYILVVHNHKNGKHTIKGLFSASQIGKQLHLDLSSVLAKQPDTIVELHKERKG